jgi:ferredoxin
MIITEQKPFHELLDSLRGYSRVFIIGCGECATTCKTGGAAEIALVKDLLIQQGMTITGTCIPSAPCIAAQVSIELARNSAQLQQTEVILVMACGLGVQSVRENNRRGTQFVVPGCNTMYAAVMDKNGAFVERCVMCGECMLVSTGSLCPQSRCPKQVLNGPCGGMNKGKCELDNTRDCVWVLIYQQLESQKKLGVLRTIKAARNYNKRFHAHRSSAAH